MVGIRDQCDLVEEIRQASVGVFLVELRRRRDKFGDVGLGLLILLILAGERGLQAAVGKNALDDLADRAIEARRKLVYQLGEGPHLPGRGLLEACVLGPAADLQQRLGPLLGRVDKPADGSRADSPGRRVDDPQAAKIVGRVGEQAKVRQHVLDLLAVVELHAAGDAVRYAALAEHVLQHARQRVDAIEYRNLIIAPAGLAPPGDPQGDLPGLGVLVVAVDHAHVLPAFAPRPELLVLPLRVVCDQLRRGLEDRPARTVVLLQADDGGVWVVGLELEDVSYVRPSPGVNALVRVAGDADVLVLDGYAVGQDVLGVVGVLILVDEDVLVTPPQHLADVRPVAKQKRHSHQKVVEVQRVVVVERLLVEAIGLRGAPAETVVAHFDGVLLGRLHLVLGVGDHRVNASGPEYVGRQLEPLYDVLGDAELVVAIVDRVVPGKVRLGGELAKQPGAQGVEGAQQRPSRDVQGIDPLLHLAGGLVGEGDGQDVPGRDALLNEVGDSPRDDAGLARPGPGQDKQRAVNVRDGLSLRLVQFGKQIGQLRLSPLNPHYTRQSSRFQGPRDSGHAWRRFLPE